MAKFSFRLQSYLSLKTKIEDQKRNEFGKAVAQVEIEKQRLADLHQEKDECIADFRHKVENSIEPYNLNRYNLYIEKIKERIKLQMAQLARAEALMKAKRAELIEAMKDRKILDTLKEKEYEAYLDEEKKNEQKILDDLVSYKYRTG